MLGKKNRAFHDDLFIYNFRIEDLIDTEHFLCKVKKYIDFSFVREEAKHLYSHTGRPSVDPVMLFKLLFLIFCEQIHSERQAIKQVKYNLLYRWFLDLKVDDELPNHNAFTRLRQRLGVEPFKRFFERIVVKCHRKGLVDGDCAFIDSTTIKADASLGSVRERVVSLYGQLDQSALRVNERYVSKTDRDAGIVSRSGHGKKLAYKDHRLVDGKKGIITQTQATSAAVADEKKLFDLIDAHEQLLDKEVESVVADTKYGTGDNYHEAQQREIKAFIPRVKRTSSDKYYTTKDFTYDKEQDVLVCPNGKTLKRFGYDKKKKRYRYRTNDCKQCQLRSKCTKSKNGRIVTLSIFHSTINRAKKLIASPEGKRNQARRKHVCETTFAEAKTLHAHRRSRYRGLWRFQMQCYIVSTIQNIKKLVKEYKPKLQIMELEIQPEIKKGIDGVLRSILCLLGGKKSDFQRTISGRFLKLAF